MKSLALVLPLTLAFSFLTTPLAVEAQQAGKTARIRYLPLRSGPSYLGEAFRQGLRAKALGLTIPPSALIRADQVIE